MVFEEKEDPILFRFITDGNLLRQHDLLKTLVEIAIQKKQCVTHEIVYDLNKYAVEFLCEHPGLYRRGPVHIHGSKHKPPPHEAVQGHMDEFLQYVRDGWQNRSAVHMAAYILWRLNWIHPFIEGNGRTARATSYFALCVKQGMWLPGTNTIPKQIKENPAPYYKALDGADFQYMIDKRINVTEMETYLSELLVTQLSS